jgi:hypothetical protein
MQSNAANVDEYLASLPEDRHRDISVVRQVILDNLDSDYEEGMQYGGIGYYVPHSVFPAGYHCDPRQPLCFAGLASQKNHMSLYLMCLYGGGDLLDWFRAAWAKAGKRLDMGKACLRFKKVDDLALEVLAEAIRRVPAKKYIKFYEANLATTKQRTKTSVAKQAAVAKSKKPVKKTIVKKASVKTKGAKTKGTTKRR